MKSIIDCGKYGYAVNEDTMVIYEWRDGWNETGITVPAYVGEDALREALEHCDSGSLSEVLSELI